jgi:hypothetical protein
MPGHRAVVTAGKRQKWPWGHPTQGKGEGKGARRESFGDWLKGSQREPFFKYNILTFQLQSQFL